MYLLTHYSVRNEAENSHSGTRLCPVMGSKGGDVHSVRFMSRRTTSVGRPEPCGRPTTRSVNSCHDGRQIIDSPHTRSHPYILNNKVHYSATGRSLRERSADTGPSPSHPLRSERCADKHSVRPRSVTLWYHLSHPYQGRNSTGFLRCHGRFGSDGLLSPPVKDALTCPGRRSVRPSWL